MLQAEELLCLQQDLGKNEGSCWSHKRLRELPLFLCNRKFRWNPLLHKKPCLAGLHCGGKVDVAEATRRRRRILQAGFFFMKIKISRLFVSGSQPQQAS